MTYGSLTLEGSTKPTREERAERRRQDIIEAAYEVFSEKGYTAAGIADIAQKLSIGHGTFYRYFENKRDILDHAVDFGIERMSDYVFDERDEPAESFDELEAQFERIGMRLYEALDSEPGLLQVALLEATSIDEEMTQRVLGLVDSFGAMAATYLDNGVRKGFLRTDLDTEVAGRALVALTMPGMVAALRGSFGPAERERQMKATIDFIARGIRA